MPFIIVYRINFSDDGPSEARIIGRHENREMCERMADLIPAVAYDGDRPVKGAEIGVFDEEEWKL